MGNIIQPAIKHFQFTDFIMNLVLADLNNDDAVKRIRNGDGCSISWIVGHLSAYRYRTMKLLGADKTNEFEALFGEPGANDGINYPEISDMLKKWNSFSKEFYALLEQTSDKQLLTQMNPEGTAHNEKTVLDTLTFFMWHESSHTGGIGLIRKEFGYRSTSDLAMEASKKAM